MYGIKRTHGRERPGVRFVQCGSHSHDISLCHEGSNPWQQASLQVGLGRKLRGFWDCNGQNLGVL